jgi:hypothetical protein
VYGALVLGLGWILALVVALWILGPIVGFFVARSPLEVDVHPEPPLARPYAEDTDGVRRYQALVDLGFRPIGWTSQHGRFPSPVHWAWRELQGERWLASPDDRTFVSLSRVEEDEPVRFGALTLFEGGGSWSTQSRGGATPKLERFEDHGRDELRGVSLEELLATHAVRAAEFSRARGRAIKEATLPEVAAASLAHSRARLAAMHPAYFLAAPLLGFVLLAAFFAARAMPTADRADPALPICFVMMGLLYAVGRHSLLKLTARTFSESAGLTVAPRYEKTGRT